MKEWLRRICGIACMGLAGRAPGRHGMHRHCQVITAPRLGNGAPPRNRTTLTLLRAGQYSPFVTASSGRVNYS